MINRRKFMAAGTGSLVSLSLPLAVEAGSPEGTETIPAIDPKLCAECDIFNQGQLIARIKLVGLSNNFRSDPRMKQYILNFESTPPVKIPEASYEVVHPVLGRLHLFLQPSGTLNVDQHDGKHYRACMAMLV